MPTRRSLIATLFRAIIDLRIADTPDADFVPLLFEELQRTTRGRIIIDRAGLDFAGLAAAAESAIIEAELMLRSGTRYSRSDDDASFAWKIELTADAFRPHLWIEQRSWSRLSSVEPLQLAQRGDGSELLEKHEHVLAASMPTYDDDDLSDLGIWKYADCVVSIPRHHRRGSFERPFGDGWLRSDLQGNEREHVTIISRAPISEAGAFQSIGPSDVLLFVHGFKTDPDAAIRRAAQLKTDVRFKGRSVAFIWPSKGTLTLNAYRADRAYVPRAADGLFQLIMRLATGHGKVHIFAHSLGCAIVTKMTQVYAVPLTGLPVGEVIFGAPDISEPELSSLIPLASTAYGRLTVYFSQWDPALYFSWLVNGRVPVGLRLPIHLTMRPIENVDASKVWHHFDKLLHSYVFGSSLLLTDIHDVYNGKPQTRFQLKSLLNDRYWEFA